MKLTKLQKAILAHIDEAGWSSPTCIVATGLTDTHHARRVLYRLRRIGLVQEVINRQGRLVFTRTEKKA